RSIRLELLARGNQGISSRARGELAFTPLHFAVQRGDLEAVKALLEAGADVDKPTTSGMSPLVLAINNAHYEVAAYLLRHGADPNADGQGWSALHQVARMRGP